MGRCVHKRRSRRLGNLNLFVPDLNQSNIIYCLPRVHRRTIEATFIFRCKNFVNWIFCHTTNKVTFWKDILSVLMKYGRRFECYRLYHEKSNSRSKVYITLRTSRKFVERWYVQVFLQEGSRNVLKTMWVSRLQS